MRHGATLIAALEGLDRAAYHIAKELALNSRAGLTTRFLSKKLEMAEEEVEYLVDLNHRLFFSDLTKVRLVAEGSTAIRRIAQGLENRGDVPSLFRCVKDLSPHEFRRLEEQVGIEEPGGRKAAAEEILERCYGHPESVVHYVAQRNFSTTAKELFDILWQSDDGVMPVSLLRTTYGGSDCTVEMALSELFDGFALFEMFRFDQEDRLVRVAGLLSEIRQWNEMAAGQGESKALLRPLRGKPDIVDSRGIDLSDRLCRLVAAIAARPVRLRGDGDLFREDRRRLSEICVDGEEPSLNTCLWIAQGIGWLARVDNELRAGDLEKLLRLDPLSRHRIVYDWLVAGGNEPTSRRTMLSLLEDVHPDTWYPVVGAVNYSTRLANESDQPILKNAGGHWLYVSPNAASGSEKGLARSLEETYLWTGVVDRAEVAGESAFRVTNLGVSFLRGVTDKSLSAKFPKRGAEIVVQPNFDIVVPTQSIDPLLTVPFDQFATRQSTGQATVYHLSKESFTRAVQEGHDGDAFVEFLLEHNRGGELPSNVMTTLDDWRGGMKRVRLKTIQVLESEDALVVADLMHRRRFNKHFRKIDPRTTVVYSKISKAELAKELEKEGFVVE